MLTSKSYFVVFTIFKEFFFFVLPIIESKPADRCASEKEVKELIE